MKRFCICSLWSHLNILTFSPLTGGCSEGLDALVQIFLQGQKKTKNLLITKNIVVCWTQHINTWGTLSTCCAVNTHPLYVPAATCHQMSLFLCVLVKIRTRLDLLFKEKSFFFLLTFSVLVINPKNTTLHCGQSRSWSAEQGKENKSKSLAAYPPPHCMYVCMVITL